MEGEDETFTQPVGSSDLQRVCRWLAFQKELWLPISAPAGGGEEDDSTTTEQGPAQTGERMNLDDLDDLDDNWQ